MLKMDEPHAQKIQDPETKHIKGCYKTDGINVTEKILMTVFWMRRFYVIKIHLQQAKKLL